MNPFAAALWAETLKARRSKVPWLTALGFLAIPFVGGLFMVILRDPARARSLGLISTKAQLAAGTADWPAYVGLLAQAIGVGGLLVFALVTAWVFGREFSEHTAKDLLALPTPRAAIVAAKFTVVAAWVAAVSAVVLALAFLIGSLLRLPGGSPALLAQSGAGLMATAGLTLALMPLVALMASAGRGYLPPLGWAMLTLIAAQIVAALGWGAWFPWSVPALFSGLAGPPTSQLGPQSLVLVALTCAVGLAGTFAWWRSADQAG